MHHPQPAVLSITQPTEYGTIYNLTELKKIAKHCKENNIFLHIDGTRIFNALAAPWCTLSNFARISGVDVLTRNEWNQNWFNVWGICCVFQKQKVLQYKIQSQKKYAACIKKQVYSCSI